MSAIEPRKRTVLTRISKDKDLERHVCLVEWPNRPDFGRYLEIADYIPSRKMYGRGYMFPEEDRSKIIAGLRARKPVQA